MSQTSSPSTPDDSPATRQNDSLVQSQKRRDTGADPPAMSHVGASTSIDIDRNPQMLRAPNTAQVSPSQYGYYYSTGQASSPHHTPYAYYPVPTTAWGNSSAWPSPYTGDASSSTMPYYSYSHAQRSAQPTTLHPVSSPALPATSASRPPSPSASPQPSPLLQVRGHWDSAIREFLESAGLTQALRGFEADVIVMNPEWEQRRISPALEGLVKNILALREKQIGTSADEINGASAEEQPLDDRKLQYLRSAFGKEPQSQTSTIKDIAKFLASNHARNDASNRQEFLQSKAERGYGSADDSLASTVPSCARTDARTQNRDVQMKYDIAKNEDGPLRKTLHGRNESSTAPPEKGPTQGYDQADRIPGLDERLRDLESHLAARYVPSPPRSLLDRLKFLEDHVVQLEKEYPPWAALHFNQPRRGWPPPPRPTPIIVPSHLTSTSSQGSYPGPSHGHSSQTTTEAPPASMPVIGSELSDPATAKSKGKSSRTKSSLHRAVMEKLEVQRAMHDLSGAGD